MIQLMKSAIRHRIYKITTNDLWAEIGVEAEDKFIDQLHIVIEEAYNEHGMKLASIGFFRDSWIIIFRA
jgi:hypothetical protein